MSFWGELRRRNVVKVGLAYAIVAWLVLQVADTVLPTFGASPIVAQTLTVVLVLGFPVTLVIAWAFEVTPDGIKKTGSLPLAQRLAQIRGERLNHVLIGLLGLAVIFLLIDDYFDDLKRDALLSSRVPMEPMSVDAQAAVAGEPETPDEVPGILENSIAVLQCDNLSPDPDNAYFAAGLHEALLNRLYRLKNLKVTARSSVLRYAVDTRPTIPEIADELGVESVMECSVAYADGRIVITAQLIDGETGLHIWSEQYYRLFEDVFGIQSDIAMNVANALQAEFSEVEQERIESRPTENLEAYGLYLRALNAEREESIRLLESAIGLDPEFALAHALKAQRYAYAGRFIDNPEPAELANWVAEAEKAAETALSLDASLGTAHVALGILHESRLNIDEARRSFEMAYQLSPADPVVLEWSMRFYRNRGEFDRAIEIGTRMAELNPNDWWLQHLLGVTYRYAGDYESAAQWSRAAIAADASQPNPHVGLALVEAASGNRSAALDQLRIAESLGAADSTFRLAQMALAYAHAGIDGSAERLAQEFERIARNDPQLLSLWAMIHVATHQYDEALEYIQRAVQERASADINMMIELRLNGWGDKTLLAHPQFEELRERIFAD